ncbi:MAG: sugar phosphate isomerase/epimerase, partial [Nitrospinae bacterium]|nr:sugar phosphate isomerase/epimerase [Nitrospinota bacterium]
ERLAPFCAATHLHDNDGRNDAHLIPGEGAFEWPSFFTTLDARRYSGTLALELRRKEEPYARTLADAASAIKAIKSQIKPSPA